MRCEMCGPDNMHEHKWVCEGCGGLVLDDTDSGTKCPGCSAPRGKKNGTDQATTQPKSLLPKMKAASEQTYLRAAENGAAMALPQQTQEVILKAAKLEDFIRDCEKMGDEDSLAIAEKKKLELKTLQSKLPPPTQDLKDHVDVVNSLRELEDKGSGETRKLEDKKKQNGEEQKKIRTDADAQMKAIRDKMTEQIKNIEETAKRRIATKRDEQTAIEKDLVDLAKEIDEKRQTFKQRAATTATELVNIPKPPADAVMVPCLPGSIIHSNHVKPEIMLQAAMNDQGLKDSGQFSAEQLALFTKWSLTFLNQSSLMVPEQQPAPAASSLQTTQSAEDAKTGQTAKAAENTQRDAGQLMEAEAENKRKIAETDDVYTDESSGEEEMKEVVSLNNKDEGKPAGKEKVLRSLKKERKAKENKGKK